MAVRGSVALKPKPPVPQATVSASTIANLNNCIEDSRRQAQDNDPGPADPTNFANLQGRLATARDHLPPIYRAEVFDPYVSTLNGLGVAGFSEILLTEPNASILMMDIAHTILQNGEGFQEQALDAFQEVVSDLYDGFLSAEDRVGVLPPDRGALPPLVKFGRPEFGPYTFTIEATSSFRLATTRGLGAGLVSLPPSQARLGLLGWSALSHETAGHDILGADTGLKAQISGAVRGKLRSAGLNFLARYWAARIDETASDVLGILNMGPAAAIGLIGFFRGLNLHFSGSATLRNVGPAEDPHPADIVRGFLGAATVRLLEFDDHDAWADLIKAETMKDAGTIRLAGRPVTQEDAIRSAELVAEAVATTEFESLEDTALIDIQNWRNHDEEIVAELGGVLTRSTPLPASFGEETFAAHTVAAGVTSALAAGADLSHILRRMIAVLKMMHDANPSWGPLFVTHPGNVKAHRSYLAAA